MVKGKSRKKERDARLSRFQYFNPRCALLPLMPKDTLDDKTVLEILQMADEDMLRKSGNPVYLSLKAEYDRLR